MKISFLKISLLTVLGLCMFPLNGNAQILKKLKKKAEQAVERKLEKKVEKETEKAMDSVLDPNTNGSAGNAASDLPDGSDIIPTAGTPGSLKLYSNFDFVPGDQILLYDDFSVDNLGDFPAKWNTDGTGEVVSMGETQKWFSMVSGSVFIPDLPKTLPENYTVEFDVKATNLSPKTSSIARLHIYMEDNNALRRGHNYVETEIPFCQYVSAGFSVYNYFRDQDPANSVSNTIDKDLRPVFLDVVHVSIAVNGKRYRMWINQNKVIDLPRFITETGKLKYLKLEPTGFEGDKYGEKLLISNFKIAEGGLDLRSKLVKEGKFSTTGILFDSGSDRIKPESYSTLKLIADALASEPSLKVKVIGHTDSDGGDTANMELSKKRAAAVKVALSGEFNINADRLETDGKGETMPVSDNNSAAGKAKNRRVEFVKM